MYSTCHDTPKNDMPKHFVYENLCHPQITNKKSKKLLYLDISIHEQEYSKEDAITN